MNKVLLTISLCIGVLLLVLTSTVEAGSLQDPLQVVKDTIRNRPDTPGNCQDYLVTDTLVIWFNRPVSTYSLVGRVTMISRLGEPTPDFLYRDDDDHFEVVSSNGMFTPLDRIGIIINSAVTDLQGDTMEADDTVWAHFGPNVYPGDTDNNGVVDERDILPLGIFWSTADCPRHDVGDLTFVRNSAHSWTQLRATYADADGNGVVDSADICGIAENWGQTQLNGVRSGSQQNFLALAETDRDVIQKLYAALANCDHVSAGAQRLGELLQAAMDQPETEVLPTSFELSQNYPNPFNPTTTIRFYLPLPGRVQLSVFNVTGQEVAVLLDETMPSGYGEIVWNGTDQSDYAVASGLYLYRLTAGETVLTKRMLLLK
ncbi:MAG: T9SS type A sorting domain-containing protein [candidate division Zixibacteria bacterium]|nr:T9SS type A sorting domain-containing protein [candidate division Zixibacteria bacterium]